MFIPSIRGKQWFNSLTKEEQQELRDKNLEAGERKRKRINRRIKSQNEFNNNN